MTTELCIPAGLPVDIYTLIYDLSFGYDSKKHTPEHMTGTNNLKGVKWIVQHKKWNKETDE
jgi:hypothetical protein